MLLASQIACLCISAGKPQCYLLYRDALLEVTRYRNKYNAWFVGTRVVSNGGLFMCTPIDVLFLALPLLRSCRRSGADSGAGVFTSLDNLLESDGQPQLHRLTELLKPHLPCVCDVKQVADDSYYRLSDARVLAWLCCKVQQVRGVDSKCCLDCAISMDVFEAGSYAEPLECSFQGREISVCAMVITDIRASRTFVVFGCRSVVTRFRLLRVIQASMAAVKPLPQFPGPRPLTACRAASGLWSLSNVSPPMTAPKALLQLPNPLPLALPPSSDVRPAAVEQP